MLPNFLVIGAMKAGTTSLYEYLRHHPQVFMSSTKELNFFSHEGKWALGASWYGEQFPPRHAGTAIGEASTTYAMHPVFTEVPQRIASLIPTVRLIYIVRHPIERIFSHYLHDQLLGLEKKPIDRAVLEKPQYVDFSRYSFQIGHYLDFFPREQLLILTTEELRDARSTIPRVLSFLRLASDWDHPVLDERFHTSANKRVRRATAARIQQHATYRALSRTLPEGFKSPLRRLTTKGNDRAPTSISDPVRRQLEDMLVEDVRSLRSYMDPEFHGWGLA